MGSVSTNLVLINEENEILVSLYLRTRGEPIKVVQEGLKEIGQKPAGSPVQIRGAGTAGSARYLTGVVGAV